MIKSILVALDKSSSSTSAKKLGIKLAKTYNAHLSGIGVLDEPWIVAPEAIPLGGAAFKVELDDKMIKKAREQIHKLEQSFMDECAEEKIKASVIDAVGIPAYEIKHFLTEYDLLIVGKDADFHFTDLQETNLSVKQLVRDNPRPVIVTSASLPNQDSSTVLVGYDGSFAASRALHLAILTGMFKNKTVHIASISTDEDDAHEWLNAAAKLCQKHSIKPHIHPAVSAEKPAKVLLSLAADIKPSLLVIGAYGHSGLSYLFKGSCAKALLQESEVPIFMYH